MILIWNKKFYDVNMTFSYRYGIVQLDYVQARPKPITRKLSNGRCTSHPYNIFFFIYSRQSEYISKWSDT